MRTLLTAMGPPLVAAILILASGTTALAQETAIVHVKQASLTGHSCDATQWHFVINQLTEGQAPASITVTWEGGATETVALTKTSGSVAHYFTTANLGIQVSDATATIVGPWSGQFVVSSGPCFGTALTVTATTAATEQAGSMASATGANTRTTLSASPSSGTQGFVNQPGVQNRTGGNAAGAQGFSNLPSTSSASNTPIAALGALLMAFMAFGALLLRRLGHEG
jgi:LPXTG-motif cell wall-anchored protein